MKTHFEFSITDGLGWFEAKKKFHLVINFRMTMMVNPRTQSGILVAIKSLVNNKEYFLLEFANKKVMASVNDGMNVQTITNSKQLSLNNWNKIDFIHSHEYFSLVVNETQKYSSGKHRYFIDTYDANLYIGGKLTSFY